MSTKQSVKAFNSDTTGCMSCKHFNVDGIFVLCTHPRSEYRYEGKVDHHTIVHMREEQSPCGLGAALKVAR